MRNGGLADSLELIHRQAKIQALVPADAVEGACGSRPMPLASYGKQLARQRTVAGVNCALDVELRLVRAATFTDHWNGYHANRTRRCQS
jgi:hypothetical protein